MPPHPSPLADSVATLRAATLATPAHAWLPAAIHALILACLARIFGRLEEMIRLWQAGLLPPPTHRPRTAQITPASSTPASSRQREARQASHSVYARTAERVAAEAGIHMETESQREESKNLSSCVSLSLRVHVKILPFRPASCAAPENHASTTPSAYPITCSPRIAFFQNDPFKPALNHTQNVAQSKQ